MTVEPEGELKAARNRQRSEGIIVLNKPSGPTSRELVNQVEGLLSRTKVGHAGTLDPLADGILILCIGVTTKLIEVVQNLGKAYQTVVRLGARSDTDDAQGAIVADLSGCVPGSDDVHAAVRGFVGKIMQMPPEYSAVKIKGRRAYDLARAGKAVELAPREVQINRIEVLSYSWPLLALEIECSKGTYIRSLARDVGDCLGCGGLVETLTRTRIGPFTQAHATDPRELSRKNIASVLRPALEAVSHLERICIDNAQVEAVANGRTIAMPDNLASYGAEGSLVALVDGHSRLIALAECEIGQRRLQPRKVLIGS